MYSSTKIIDGFSTNFRQEKAAPIHCSILHGYSISFEVEFEALELDGRQWVTDFGFMKRSNYLLPVGEKEGTLDEWFKYMFDHTTVISKEDTELEWFKQGHDKGVLNLRIVDYVGCERFAEMVFDVLTTFLVKTGQFERVKVKKVICRENPKNSASYYE